MSLTKDNKEDVIKEFGRTNKDTGSAEVQIALLTRRIEDLTGPVSYTHLTLPTN